ncbi:MAG: type II toxin-antitoxin system VapC family toxin [bacterium]
MIVVDASAVNAVLLRESSGEAVIEALEDEEMFLAPALVLYEVGNALTVAVRRGRLTNDDAVACSEKAAMLPWVLETHAGVARTRAVLELALESGLTVYDASFIELAKLRGCPLVSLDREMRRAAQRVGVEVRPRVI